jgi:hypothetical protein
MTEATDIKATPTVVYIIKITAKTLHPTHLIGACYLHEEEAQAECERLMAANSYIKANYVSRQLG